MTVNKVILVGRLGADPEIRYTAAGAAMTNVSIATSEQWKDKQTGQKQERTEWHRVMFYDRLAEIVGEYLRKGSLVYIEGRIQTRKWQDQNGQDRWSTDVVATEMKMLGGRGGDVQAAPPMGNEAEFAPAPSNPPSMPSASSRGRQSAGNPPVTNQAPARSSPPPSDFDDDIPF